MNKGNEAGMAPRYTGHDSMADVKFADKARMITMFQLVWIIGSRIAATEDEGARHAQPPLQCDH